MRILRVRRFQELYPFTPSSLASRFTASWFRSELLARDLGAIEEVEPIEKDCGDLTAAIQAAPEVAATKAQAHDIATHASQEIGACA